MKVELPSFPAQSLLQLLPLAFAEDEGSGDITSLSTLDPKAKGKAELLCKQSGILAGLPLVQEIFSYRGIEVQLKSHCEEGQEIQKGDVILSMQGPLYGLLVSERLILNFMQRLSGIATATNAFAKILDGTKTKILDTRKTLPGFRALDKYAVAIGGGKNHRMGLFDMILVKDNHAEACGSVRAAVDRAFSKYGNKFTIEAEVSDLEELESLFTSSANIFLLDNMDDDLLEKSIQLSRKFAPHIKLEASGNMDLERIRRIRDFGLDYISVGALTHSVMALDISMNIVGIEN